jgi:hypothetical protein
MVEAPPPPRSSECIPHPYDMYTTSFVSPLDNMLLMDTMGAHPHSVTPVQVGGWTFWGNWGSRPEQVEKWYWCYMCHHGHGWGLRLLNPLLECAAFHTHNIGCIHSVLAPWYHAMTMNRYMGPPLHFLHTVVLTCLCRLGVDFFFFWGGGSRLFEPPGARVMML